MKRKITDYQPDPHNPNLHSERGLSMLEDSIAQVGLGRSILVDKNGYIIAGNATQERAVDQGFEDAIEVETEGNELVVVRRKDLDLLNDPDYRARLASIFDNRVSEVSLTWSPEALDSYQQQGVPLDRLWTPVELDVVLAGSYERVNWSPDEITTDNVGDGISELVGYSLASFWKDFSRETEFTPYMLPLPQPPKVSSGATIKAQYSRTNATETERIIKTYMRPGDVFYEMCCGWMTFSSTAKYFGYSGKGGDIWDKSIAFCTEQIKKMPGAGRVEVVEADCRATGEPDNAYDFVHSNPPFFSLEEYSNNESDLAATGSYDHWLLAMGEMGKEAERILKPGGLANFVINDFREIGILKPMHSDFIQSILNDSGLVLHDLVVAEVISQALRFRKHDYELRRTVKCHEYVITFKKPS